MINPSSEHRGGIETPEFKGQKAAIFYAVFLCPSKIKAGYIRLKSIMVGCIGQPQGWPVPLSGSLNPVQPASQRLRPMEGGLSSNKGATAMNKSVQNSANTEPEITPELNLVYICQEIGGIAESSCQYTAGLTRRIAETGKPLKQLTVAELLTLHRQHKEWFNENFKG